MTYLLNRSQRQMIADYADRYGITPDRDEPPPESGDVDPQLLARIRAGAARMEADRERMREWPRE